MTESPATIKAFCGRVTALAASCSNEGRQASWGCSVFGRLRRFVATRVAGGAFSTLLYASDPKKEVLATRPLCPHPQVARYKGQGDPNDAASFACASASP
jgi:hypothetical protein